MKKISAVVLLLICQSFVLNSMHEYKYKKFFEATQNGDEATVLEYLKHNRALLTAVDSRGDTVLHYACALGLDSMVCLLVGYGADLNASNGDGDRPLHRAIDFCREATTLLLLKDIRTLVNPQNNKGDAPLHRAAFNKLLRVVRALIARRADINIQNLAGERPLHCAIESSDQAIAAELLRTPGIVVDCANKKGDRPLHRAVFHDLRGTVDLILANRIVDVDVVDGKGDSSLHIAVEMQREELVAHLAALGNVNGKNGHGDTPLHRAAFLPKSAITKHLLDHGAKDSVNVQNGLGFTPLHSAVMNRQFANVELLSQVSGINANLLRQCVNRDFQVCTAKTALSDSLTGDNVDDRIPQALMTIPGIDYNLLDEQSRTPLMNAITAFDARPSQLMLQFIITLLKKRDLEVDVQDVDRCTALHHAVNSLNAAVLVERLLLRPLKAVEAKNRDQESPRELARRLEKKDIIDMLEHYDYAKAVQDFE